MWYKKCNLEILYVGLKIKLVLHQHKHFHPSGDIEPSWQDRQITKRIFEAGEIHGIPLKDHIILGAGDNYFSFRRSGLLGEIGECA